MLEALAWRARWVVRLLAWLFPQHLARYPLRIGFHAVPSMRQLHLHVLTLDFQAPTITRTIHWHVNTGPIFLRLLDALSALRAGQALQAVLPAAFDRTNLRGDLCCIRCRRFRVRGGTTFKDLLEHFRACSEPIPEAYWEDTVAYLPEAELARVLKYATPAVRAACARLSVRPKPRIGPPPP